MNRLVTKFFCLPARLAVCVGVTMLLLCQTVRAQSIPNSSFESNGFTVAPGYISDNTAITGWTTDNPAGAGLNPTAGDTSFANNGAIPDGTNVAFISGGASLSTTVTGLTSGRGYKVTLRANATTGQTPILRANIDGTDLLNLAIYPVGSTAPYAWIAFEFTAASASASLTLANDAATDQTLLIDSLSVAESGNRWTVDAWTDDATSGVDNQFVYTHAYNFGSTASPVINGVPFTGVSGVNPSVANKFAATRFPNVFNNDANNITGASATLARDFLYSGANVVSGTFQSIALQGLDPGREYVLTIYSAGWESPSPTVRWATVSVGDDRFTINQDQFDNNNGIRVSHRYTAGTNGTAVLNIAPVNPVNVSVHIYGFSNREAVSRNVAPGITVQPTSATVAQGVPVDFSVTASGFPSPTFQWRFNGTNIAGATTNIHTIAEAASQNAGTYDVIVSNSLGSITSIVARLVVGLPMANPSFEVDSFASWPGYSGENPGNANTPAGPNVPITGWTQSAPENSGINPISNGEAPFADNGNVPHGRQVAFLQSVGGITNILSQTVTGLTSGAQYYLHYYENSRAGTPNPALEVTLGGATFVPAHPVPSGNYREVFTEVFSATATSVDLAFNASSPNGGDTTTLIDNVAIVPVAPGTAPLITQNPVATAVPVGESATFSAQVIGSLPLNYQWFRNGTAIPGATNAALLLTNVQLTAQGDYSLQVTNVGGSVTSTAVGLTVTQPVPGLFNTGVNDSRVALADGEVDPHYQLIVNPHAEGSTSAFVEDSTVFPIVAGPWLANTVTSKWIGPELNTVAGAVGLYTYRTMINLTNRDPRSVVIVGRWSTDNAGRDILVNGVSTGNPENPGFNTYTPFAIYGTNTTFNAGTNTIDFIVENVADPGYTGLRVEFLQSNALPSGPNPGNGPILQIARSGTSITISWSPAAAGQKLQSASDIQGSWNDVSGATNPYTTNMTGERMFFRVIQ
jgi:hypothetical protein